MLYVFALCHSLTAAAEPVCMLVQMMRSGGTKMSLGQKAAVEEMAGRAVEIMVPKQESKAEEKTTENKLMEIIKHILLGSLFIVIGIVTLYYSYKNPIKSIGLRPSNYSGYLGGLTFILTGVLECFGYWHW